MSIGRRAVAAVISLVIVAASWVLGLGAFLWTFAATDFRWIAFAVSVLVAWIACMWSDPRTMGTVSPERPQDRSSRFSS